MSKPWEERYSTSCVKLTINYYVDLFKILVLYEYFKTKFDHQNKQRFDLSEGVNELFNHKHINNETINIVQKLSEILNHISASTQNSNLMTTLLDSNNSPFFMA